MSSRTPQLTGALASGGVCGCKFDHDQLVRHAKAILMASDLLHMADFARTRATDPHVFSRAPQLVGALASGGVCGCKFDHDQVVRHAKAILMASDVLQMADFARTRATEPPVFSRVVLTYGTAAATVWTTW